MKTHADIIDQLKTMETSLRAEYAVTELGLVSANVEYKPVASVRLFVVGPGPEAFGRLEEHLTDKLGLTVGVIARANANGTFRFVFTSPRPE